MSQHLTNIDCVRCYQFTNFRNFVNTTLFYEHLWNIPPTTNDSQNGIDPKWLNSAIKVDIFHAGYGYLNTTALCFSCCNCYWYLLNHTFTHTLYIYLLGITQRSVKEWTHISIGSQYCNEDSSFKKILSPVFHRFFFYLLGSYTSYAYYTVFFFFHCHQSIWQTRKKEICLLLRMTR